MAWIPISGIVPQATENGNQANGMILKFYMPGTVTPMAVATTNTGATTTTEFTLNTEGYTTLSGVTVIPHVNGIYKIALYLNSTDADANDVGSAVYVIDNVDVGKFGDPSVNTPVIEPRYQTGGTNTFETTATVQESAASFVVNVDGVTQRPITDYTVSATGQIVLVGAYADNLDVDITFWQPSVIVPGIGVGMVTAAYTADGIVTDFAIPASGSILGADMINTFDGVVQEDTVDYTIVSGTHVRTVGTLPNGARVVIRTTRLS